MKLAKLAAAITAALLATAPMAAENVPGLIIKAGNEQQTVPLSLVKELTFNDLNATIQLNDGTELTFGGEWLITMGKVPTSGSQTIEVATNAEIFDIKGNKVGEISDLSEISSAEFPAGIYIVKFNDKTIKVRK